MATLEVGKIFVPESAEVIRRDLLDDFYLEARKYGVTAPSVAPGTDNWFFFGAFANASMLQYSNIAQIGPALTPLLATGQDLENWRLALNLPVAEPTGASGSLTLTVTPGEVTTVEDGQQFLLPNGQRGRVVGTRTGVVDGSDVPVQMIDTGTTTNAAAGTKVRLVNPPFHVSIEARVSRSRPLTGGTATETEARKRARILNRLGTSAGGGNWGQHRETSFNASSGVQDAFVYPALGGPSSEKVVIVRPFDPDRNDFHRQASEGLLATVREAIQRTNSQSVAIVVDTVDEESDDVALYIDIPDSSLAGGSGLGWVDQQPWPQPSGHTLVVEVTGVTSTTAFTIGEVDTSLSTIVAGLTHISWWAPGDQQFRTALVVSFVPSGATFDVVVDTPMVDSNGTSIAAGDLISPPAVNMTGYGKTFLALMNALGPGENVTPAAGDTPRRLRHPDITEGAMMSVGTQFLGAFIRRHPEMEDASFILGAMTPTVATTVEDRPNVLVPRHFAVYPAL